MRFKNLFLGTSFFVIFQSVGIAEKPMNPSNTREARLGLLLHDIRMNPRRREKGVDINGEILFKAFQSRFPESPILDVLLTPQPHLGLAINSSGATNTLYGGLTWRFPKDTLWFVEATFGGVVHDGEFKRNTAKHRALGSRVLFRESIGVGVVLGERHTLSAAIAHVSNASLAHPNPGLTSVGVRYGYRFDSFF